MVLCLQLAGLFIYRLARDLPLPKGLVQPSQPTVRENAAPSYKSVSQGGPSNAQNDEGDDEDGEGDDLR